MKYKYQTSAMGFPEKIAKNDFFFFYPLFCLLDFRIPPCLPESLQTVGGVSVFFSCTPGMITFFFLTIRVPPCPLPLHTLPHGNSWSDGEQPKPSGILFAGVGRSYGGLPRSGLHHNIEGGFPTRREAFGALFFRAGLSSPFFLI